MPGEQILNFNAYLAELEKAQGFRDQIGQITNPDIARLYEKAAATAEQRANEMATDPAVQSDALVRGEEVLTELAQLAAVRDYVGSEEYDAASRPVLERIQPVVVFILRHEITNERSEAIIRAAAAAGVLTVRNAVVVEQPADPAPEVTAPTAPSDQTTEPTTPPTAESTDKPVIADEQPAKPDVPHEPAVVNAPPDADTASEEIVTKSEPAVPVDTGIQPENRPTPADSEPHPTATEPATTTAPAETTEQLTSDGVRERIFAKIRSMKPGDTINPEHLWTELFSNTPRTSTTRHQALRSYHKLIESGAISHNGRRGPASAYAVLDPVRVPNPNQQSEAAPTREAYNPDRYFSIRDAQRVASILDRYRDMLQNAGIQPPITPVLDTIFDATPPMGPIDEQAIKRERDAAYENFKAILTGVGTTLEELRSKLPEDDPRAPLVAYLHMLQLMEADNLTKLAQIIEVERQFVVEVRRHQVVGVIPPRQRTDTISSALRAADDERTDTARVAEAAAEEQPVYDERLVNIGKQQIAKMVKRALKYNIELEKPHYPVGRIANRLDIKHYLDKLRVAGDMEVLDIRHSIQAPYTHVSATELIIAQLCCDHRLYPLFSHGTAFVKTLIEEAAAAHTPAKQ